MPASTRSVFARHPAFPRWALAPTRTLPAVHPSERRCSLPRLRLFTHSAVKPDVPNYVDLDYTEHMTGGLSASRSSELAMLLRLRKYQKYLADNPCRVWVLRFGVPTRALPVLSCFFFQSLLT
jgi:hypothetical protein